MCWKHWLCGRGGEIRTPDILLPKQARYRTALHPERNKCGKSDYGFKLGKKKQEACWLPRFYASSKNWLKDLSIGKSKLRGCWLPQELAEKRNQDRLRDWPQRNVARFHCRFV